MRIVLKNFRVVDEETDMPGTVVIEGGVIAGVLPDASGGSHEKDAAFVIDGSRLCGGGSAALMPAFVDLHAHFREAGFQDKEGPFPSEVLESASLSAVAGGFTTVVCMANTKPVIDTPERAAVIKSRCNALGLVDLYPVMSLTKGMEGRELSRISALPSRKDTGGSKGGSYIPRMLSEDGKDVASDDLFLAAMKEAKRIGVPISCHCDFGGQQAQAAKQAGQPRSVYSRMEENNAVRRVIELGRQAGCHIHIAHVSTKEAVQAIREAKAGAKAGRDALGGGFVLTCEVMPHNLCLTEDAARKLGEETWGRVNPPLRGEDDRNALIHAVADGTINAIATDHAPHSNADKEAGSPGFSAFETAFAAAFTELVRDSGAAAAPAISMKRLSSLMSASPARLIGLGGAGGRGRILPGMRADLVIVDTESSWIVEPESFKTRGKNSPFTGLELSGKVLMTIRGGRVVFDAGKPLVKLPKEKL
ncbi:MAG: dihydroorotase [Treponema sp.]|nr:dihydroorotase [Treponema sp.]